MVINMKNRTVNRILQGVIVLLIIAICFLSVQIIRRPHYINISENEAAVIEEAVIEEAVAPTTSADIADTVGDSLSAAEPQPTSALRGKTSAKVNIRDAASDQAKVLTTVEEGYEFDIIEIQDNGWTKLKYEDQDAYISSSYVIVIQ